MVKKLRLGGTQIKSAYWTLVGMASAMIWSLQPVMADTIWDRFSTIMQDIYGQIVAISTIVAVTVGAIALIIRMNSLGFIVAYLQPLIAGGNYNAGGGGGTAI